MYGILGVERRICNCICCLLCTGPILIIVGIVFLVGSGTDTRTANISQYNSAVVAWQNSFRQQYVGAAFSLLQSSNINLSIAVDTSPDPFSDSDPSIMKYDAYKFRIPNPLWPNPLSWTVNGPSSKWNFNFYSSNVNGSGSSFSSTSVPLMTETSYSASSLGCNFDSSSSNYCPTVCHNKGGDWDSGVDLCYVEQQLSSFCTKVSLNGNSAWIPDTTYGGIGCNPLNSWYPENYQYHSYTSDWAYFDTCYTTIRSAHDPYVAAAYLTDGTYNFGLTTTQKFIIGVSLLSVGIADVVIMGLVVFGIWKCCRRDRHHHHHESSPFIPN